jgi:D-serine deaminase-like pyridoxal phosphate-dependent protein
MRAVKIQELTTPAAVVEGSDLRLNLEIMAKALPGSRLRPHVKAHKCTSLARLQAGFGHSGFACATVAEMEGMAAAGLGADLLLANEVLDASRLGRIADLGAGVTVAVDSEETVEAASTGGVRQVLVDVNVGLPRCGCLPKDAGRIADHARSKGLEVRGVMGYEGHVVGLGDRSERSAGVEASMSLLVEAHESVGGDILSGGGTGTYDLNSWVTEIQAGSYALMDSAYAELGLPFFQALSILATVISTNDEWSVCDAGLKSLGMDHGNPSIEDHAVWFCSDEHIVFSPPEPLGTKLRVLPSHVDPTVAYHSFLNVTDGEDVIDRWPVDLRGW